MTLLQRAEQIRDETLKRANTALRVGGFLVDVVGKFNEYTPTANLSITNWNTAFGWGNHAGLYDTLGAASAAVSGHETTYNHNNFVVTTDSRLSDARPASDVYTWAKQTSLQASAVPNLDAGKITTGVLSIDRIPASALERLHIVLDQTARYALTTATVQTGDTVKQTDTGVMYRVVDDANLHLASGYVEYSAGRAAAVDWSGVESAPATATRWPAWTEVTSKPTTFAPSAHTHIKTEITDFAHNHAWTDITSGVPATATRWPTWTEVSSKPSTFAPANHTLIGTHHTVSGLTSGHFLKATGATTYGFAAHGLTAADVSALASNHAASGVTTVKIGNWDTAFSWGNHAGLYEAAGAVSTGISGHETTYNHTNYNTAFSWGDHAGLYRLAAWVPTWTDVTSKPDTATRWPTWTEVTSKPTTFTPSAHTHTKSEVTDFAHTHGNITNVGAIGTISNLVVITTTSGVLTTSSRSGIDSRTTFPPSAHTLNSHTASNLANLNAIISDATLIDTGDSRLSDARVASDVYAWAKASTKPAYTYTEVGAAAASHTHTKSQITDFAHVHGNISNTGAIGTAADLVIVTGTSGVLTTQSRSGIDSRSTFPPSSHALNAHSAVILADLNAIISDGTLIDTGDSRLSNSREWTATTVTQIEAEAGTATTRRAWTAERVKQAILALAPDPDLSSYVVTTDSRLSDARPASDVYAWAKAASKPAYTYTEVGAAAASHTHTKSQITDFAHTLNDHGASNLANLNAIISDATLDSNTASRPASDVSSWAKAASKPSYSYTEVGAAAASHTHGNITNDGKIGTATDLVVTTTTGGLLTTLSRSGIDSRSTFPPSSHALSAHTAILLSALNALLTDATLDTNTGSRPASDVSAWAKAATKPDYTYSEVGAAAASHTHTKANITDFAHTHTKSEITDFAHTLNDHGSSTLANLNTIISDATLIDTGDSRLSDSRTASDVYAWAKASSKPSYTYTEVGAAASSHTHGTYSRSYSLLSGATVFSNLTISNGIVTATHTRNLTAANIGAEPTLNADQKRKITYGTAAPSGGADGDIYMQYE